MSILKRKTKTAKTATEAKVASEVKATTPANVLVAKPVVLSPRVTEKAAVNQTNFNKYTFLVEKNATKGQVKRAVAEEYKVTPTNVNMINVEGKVKRSAKGPGRRSDFKKALVTLPKGQSIAIHEGV